jgi:hypothetical protein
MSAFVVDPTHIDLILSVGVHGPRQGTGEGHLPWSPPYIDELLEGRATGPLDPTRANRAGAALLGECIASVAHRYPDSGPQLPGPIPTPDPARYEWTDFGAALDPIEALKAIDCLEYQSSEHPGWAASGAHAFCGRLRVALIAAIGGYEEAEWLWDTDRALARVPGILATSGPRR